MTETPVTFNVSSNAAASMARISLVRDCRAVCHEPRICLFASDLALAGKTTAATDTRLLSRDCPPSTALRES